MAVCISLVFVRMVGGLEEQKITPTPVPTPVVQTTSAPTTSPKASSTPTVTPTATPLPLYSDSQFGPYCYARAGI